MNHLLLLRVAPAVFVFLWSTGFVGAKYGMSGAEPFTYLALRFFIAFGLLGFLAVLIKSKRLQTPLDYVHAAVAGCLIHGVYLGGVFTAVYHGLPAGISAIIVSISPLLVAIVATVWLGEKLSVVNRVGLVLGFIGVVLVIGVDTLFLKDGNELGVILCIASLFGISIGTLYQKRYCNDSNLISGTCIQYLAASLFLAIPMLMLEHREITWTVEVVGALIWLVMALSVVAVLLLMFMIKHGEANRVASLFYLVPGLTSVETWLLFDETLSIIGVGGIVLCMLGVYLARRTENPVRRTA